MRDSSNHIHNSARNHTPETAANRVPAKSNLKTSAIEEEEEPPRQHQKKMSKTKKTREVPPPTPATAGGGGTPSTSSRKTKKTTRNGGSGGGDVLPSALKKTPRARESAPRSPKPSKTSSPVPKVPPKPAYKAPPSSESFVANPPPRVDVGVKKPNVTGRNNPTSSNGAALTSLAPPPPPASQSAVSVPPPPPPLSGTSLEQSSKQSHQNAIQAIKPIVLDDDDFSVAPSLAVEMRSICETKFDDVYQRGKKVSHHTLFDYFVDHHCRNGSILAI